MALFHEQVEPKTTSKLQIYIPKRAKLLGPFCYEYPVFLTFLTSPLP